MVKIKLLADAEETEEPITVEQQLSRVEQSRQVLALFLIIFPSQHLIKFKCLCFRPQTNRYLQIQNS